jgi:hypothetical protein
MNKMRAKKKKEHIIKSLLQILSDTVSKMLRNLPNTEKAIHSQVSNYVDFHHFSSVLERPPQKNLKFGREC